MTIDIFNMAPQPKNDFDFDSIFTFKQRKTMQGLIETQGHIRAAALRIGISHMTVHAHLDQMVALVEKHPAFPARGSKIKRFLTWLANLSYIPPMDKENIAQLQNRIMDLEGEVAYLKNCLLRFESCLNHKGEVDRVGLLIVLGTALKDTAAAAREYVTGQVAERKFNKDIYEREIQDLYQ